MSNRKTEGEKAVPTGISLPRDLIEEAKQHARAGGYGGLSGLTRHLLTTYLAEAGQAVEKVSRKAEAKGKKEVKRALGKQRRGQQQGK
jgi:hypothetical protein